MIAWENNILQFRAVVEVTPAGSKQEIVGAVWATARTQVDRVSRIVALEDLTLTKSNFPPLPDQGASYLAALGKGFLPSQRTIALDRLEASLAASGMVKPAPVPVTTPPRVIVSQSPALLVPITGPVVRPVPGTAFERVINTRALVLRKQGDSTYYLHVYDGWLFSHDGGRVPTRAGAAGDGPAAQDLAKSGQVDLLAAAV